MRLEMLTQHPWSRRRLQVRREGMGVVGYPGQKELDGRWTAGLTLAQPVLVV
jgi:hypothetical protein